MKKTGVLLCFLMLSSFLMAQHHEEGRYVPETDSLVLEKLEQWQDLKFGLLMHWGPYSQWGIVESWSICAEDEGWCRRTKGNNPENYTEYKKEYEQLKNTFNPEKFNPDLWAKAAKDAGMKYVVFTTKHHDGFCMFDTKTTDYKITDPACPFHKNPKADVTKAIFEAFRSQGLWAGAYFSKPDWHNKDYWWPNFATPDRNVNYDVTKYPERWNSFVNFTHQQIDELMSNYGPIDILWLDGGWVQKMTQEEVNKYVHSPNYKFSRIQSQDILMDSIVKKARAKQEGLIVVDRAVHGINQNYLTPENRVPEKTLPYPWESCMIMGGGWSYAFDANYQSSTALIHMLCDIVCKGGNLLLNIAPSPSGEWDAEAYKRLEDIGDWMDVNSKAIYGTRPIIPYKSEKVCLTQGKDKSVYLIYLNAEDEKGMPSTLFIPSLKAKDYKRAKLLVNGVRVKFKQKDDGIEVMIPKSAQQKFPTKFATVIQLMAK